MNDPEWKVRRGNASTQKRLITIQNNGGFCPWNSKGKGENTAAIQQKINATKSELANRSLVKEIRRIKDEKKIIIKFS